MPGPPGVSLGPSETSVPWTLTWQSQRQQPWGLLLRSAGDPRRPLWGSVCRTVGVRARAEPGGPGVRNSHSLGSCPSSLGASVFSSLKWAEPPCPRGHHQSDGTTWGAHCPGARGCWLRVWSRGGSGARGGHRRPWAASGGPLWRAGAGVPPRVTARTFLIFLMSLSSSLGGTVWVDWMRSLSLSRDAICKRNAGQLHSGHCPQTPGSVSGHWVGDPSTGL